jgi:integrase
MEYAEVPEFIRRLRHEQQYTTALSPHVIEFLVVTACRLSEVTGMRWVELDLDRKLWIIPAKRTKTNHEFWVPLSERAVALLRQQQKRSTGEFVWQTSKGKPIAQKTLYIHLTRRMKVSVTLHGFRASFRTWARNKMISTDEMCELALAHRPGPVKRRYLRDEAVEERRIIMDAWAAFLG